MLEGNRRQRRKDIASNSKRELRMKSPFFAGLLREGCVVGQEYLSKQQRYYLKKEEGGNRYQAQSNMAHGTHIGSKIIGCGVDSLTF